MPHADVHYEGAAAEDKPTFGVVNDVHAYITTVYQHLTILGAMACVGCAVQLKVGIFMFWPELLGSIATMSAVYFAQNYRFRLSMFLTFGFLGGWGVGPIISIYDIPTEAVLTAFALTTLIFVCFTASAMYSKRGEWLHIGGILSSCITGLFAVWVLSLFFTIPFFHTILIYGGLVVFSLYVAYDTAIMIENANNGNKDAMIDSINLFIDFLAIFKRILIILAESRD
eukprot:TRINITY_DN568_c0_g1_i3.p1 TRINITY_DN568_c0_g1~~TRINITY_DN568_c0_g1_i3.p1  ORF type:complete len:227 (+),score=32.76 TRINITY_DN568_c0_g1_i3:68-748(+)